VLQRKVPDYLASRDLTAFHIIYNIQTVIPILTERLGRLSLVEVTIRISKNSHKMASTSVGTIPLRMHHSHHCSPGPFTAR